MPRAGDRDPRSECAAQTCLATTEPTPSPLRRWTRSAATRCVYRPRPTAVFDGRAYQFESEYARRRFEAEPPPEYRSCRRGGAAARRLLKALGD